MSRDTSSPSITDTQSGSAVCRTVQRAIALEKSYKEMLHQGDEVDQRIQLWRDALENCRYISDGMYCMYG
jgi:hypothetical protein